VREVVHWQLLKTNPLTNPMEQSYSWEANSYSTSQEILHLLWHKRPPLVSMLNQMNPVDNSPPYFSKIHFNIILASTLTNSEWSLIATFSDHCVCIYYLSMRATCSAHFILLDLISLIIFDAFSFAQDSPKNPSKSDALLKFRNMVVI
jgi:hypothetical protein